MKMKFITMFIIALFTFNGVALSEPSISSVSDTVSHKSDTLSHKATITITGSEFGIKNPAAPLKWDDGEDKTTDSYSALSAEYSDAQPGPTRDGDTIPPTHQIMYRNAPYTAVNTPVNPPHPRSTKFIVGGHYEDNVGMHGGRDVQITVATSNGETSQRWFATWYYTLDPSWPACSGSMNHKTMVIQSGTQAYSNTPYNNQYFYMNYTKFPCDRSNGTGIGTQSMFSTSWCGDWYRNPTACNSSTFIGDGDKWRGNNPVDGNWIRFEYRLADDLGFLHSLVDNHYIWKGDEKPNWVSNSTAVASGIRSFTAGGYYREYLDGAGFQDSNAFRYFDDVYIDSTLSRVMLGNSPNYSSCTILEPQIPSAWSGTSITVTVNQGKLDSCGTYYLYVFDAENNHNEVGYPVKVVSSVGEKPCTPEGFDMSGN